MRCFLSVEQSSGIKSFGLRGILGFLESEATTRHGNQSHFIRTFLGDQRGQKHQDSGVVDLLD